MKHKQELYCVDCGEEVGYRTPDGLCRDCSDRIGEEMQRKKKQRNNELNRFSIKERSE